MTILDFISAEGRDERFKLISVALLAGSTNAIALMLVNSVAQAPDTATATSFALFGSMAATSVWAARYLTHRVNEIVELALFRLKIRLVEKIEKTELERIERIGTTVILDRITENVTVISSTAPAVGAIFPSLCIFVFGGALFTLAVAVGICHSLSASALGRALVSYHERGSSSADR